MAKELRVCLVKYFSQLEKLGSTWKELLSEAARPLHGLRNQAEQLRLVSQEVDNVDICNIENFRERLIFKILMGLEDEIEVLQKIIIRLNNANQDLNNRLKNLDNVRSKISLTDDSMKELIDGTPFRPPLNRLLEWAIDGYEYYHGLYVFINECMQTLQYKNEESVEKLANAFIESKSKKARINRILAFTQFLIKENPS